MTPPSATGEPETTLSPIANTHNKSTSISSVTSLQEREPSKRKRDSRGSRASISSTRSHQEYLDSLQVPSKEMVDRIGEVQERKEKEVLEKRMSVERGAMDQREREKAAEVIQRSYRGHRERRILDGMSLDPSTRWVEAIKEARYRHLTEPRARGSLDEERRSAELVRTNGSSDWHSGSWAAKQNWKKITAIARRAGNDEDSEDVSSDEDESITEHERAERRRKKMEAKLERQKAAKIMDLQYFLEMVDLKHRYGSNLRVYHEEWKKSDTNENFFYWLDYGEGRFIDCQGCPRERLDREQVRYLSKEERMDYLVKIDKEGRLCWAKNGARIDTTEKYKDSIHGIVPATDETPAFRPPEAEAATGLQDHHGDSSDSDDSEGSEAAEDDRAAKYATPELDKSKGMKKVKHVSAATIFNKLLRGSIKKNTWIFVADTSFRLYVGIKQSGAFQHSSFLHGSRISAAGLIKIKNGKLDKLSPLSGHYRPPVKNFRAFVQALKENGVDMHHVSISRSYAVLVGLEAYVRSRRRGKKIVQKLMHHRDKIISPQEVAEREEREKDKSESAARERRFLELKQQAEEDERAENKASLKLMEKLHIQPRIPKHAEGSTTEDIKDGKDLDVQVPGQGPENAIAPEGTRID